MYYKEWGSLRLPYSSKQLKIEAKVPNVHTQSLTERDIDFKGALLSNLASKVLIVLGNLHKKILRTLTCNFHSEHMAD